MAMLSRICGGHRVSAQLHRWRGGTWDDGSTDREREVRVVLEEHGYRLPEISELERAVIMAVKEDLSFLRVV